MSHLWIVALLFAVAAFVDVDIVSLAALRAVNFVVAAIISDVGSVAAAIGLVGVGAKGGGRGCW